MRRPVSNKVAAGGSVLIVVLVVCLGLVSLALLFGHSMLMAYRGSDDELAGRQAGHAIEGAARYAQYLMTNVTNDGDLPDVTTYQSAAVPVGDALFWLIGVPQPTDPPGIPVYGLVDEASKLNLNNATVAMLENLPGMTEDLAESIHSWHSPNGSGISLEGGLAATTVKSAPFESVEELAQVNGGTDLDTLYGNDTNLNHVLDTWEDTGNGQLASGLLEYVTVYSREPKTRRDGTNRVNVTGTPQSLARRLETIFPGGRGAEIERNLLLADRRTGHPSNSVLDFYFNGQLTADELGQISPYLTIGTGTYKTGLINVNTASQIVLACVPGITTELAAQLVAARLKLTAPSSDLSWVGAILGPAASHQAGPYLTTRSYQVSVDVAAAGRNGHGYRRTRFVVDSSTMTSSGATPQIVYRRDLASLGWALGTAARQSFVVKGGPQ